MGGLSSLLPLTTATRTEVSLSPLDNLGLIQVGQPWVYPLRRYPWQTKRD